MPSHPLRAPLFSLSLTGLALVLFGGGGCTSLLGSFEVTGEAVTDGATGDSADDDASPGDASGSDGNVAEVGTDAASDAVQRADSAPGEGGQLCQSPAFACPDGRCVTPLDARACGASCVICSAPPASGVARCSSLGTCTIECDTNFAACGTECKHLMTDATACGSCTKSCLGATCTGGQCQPQSLTTGLTAPTDIALAGANVLVNSGGKVRRCAKTGCTTTTPLWTGSLASVPGPNMLRADAVNAYFVVENGSNRNLYRCQLAGCSAAPTYISTLLPGTPPAQPTTDFVSFDIDPVSNTFLFAGTYGAIHEAPLAGGNELRSFAGFAGTWAVQFTPSHVVWTDHFGGGLRGCARTAGCSSSNALSSADEARAIGFHQDRVYYAINTGNVVSKWQIEACAPGGCAGAPAVIATSEDEVGGLAVDATGVYWTTFPTATSAVGRVRACRNLTAGCGNASETLASSQPRPFDVKIDATHVYWINQGLAAGAGTLNRVVK